MTERSQRSQILLFFSFVAILLILERLSSKNLFAYSFPVIKYLQTQIWAEPLWKFVSFLGSRDLKLYLLVFVFSFGNHSQAFIFSLITFSSLFFSAFIKIISQETRPFWIDPDIMAFECEKNFGFPSNHVSTTIPVFLYFWDIVYYRFEFDKKISSKKIQVIGYLLLELLFITIAISRLYMGVHSLDQVFFGYLIGYAYYFYFKFVFKADVKDNTYFMSLIKKENNINYFLLVNLIIYMFYIIILFYNNDLYDTQYVAVIELKCNKTLAVTPYMQCFIDSADYFGMIGITLAIIYDRIYLDYEKKGEKVYFLYSKQNLNRNMVNSRIGKWNDTEMNVSLIRFVFISLEIGLLNFILDTLLKASTNIMTHYIFDKAFPAFLTSFLLFNFCKTSAILFGLTN